MGIEDEAGSLTLVGTGIKAVCHVTQEAEAHIKRANKLYYLVADTVTEHWLKSANPNAESLYGLYGPDKDRSETYAEIANLLVREVVGGARVCCAFYGHPSVFASPGREAVRQLTQLGIEATILPAVSAEDCLFADLNVDPGAFGCQSFEATDFLLHRRTFDPRSSLVLWQVAIIGVKTKPTQMVNQRGLQLLVDHLRNHYPPTHGVVIYEAAQFALCQPFVLRCRLEALCSVRISPISTLYVPPVELATPDTDMIERIRSSLA